MTAPTRCGAVGDVWTGSTDCGTSSAGESPGGYGPQRAWPGSGSSKASAPRPGRCARLRSPDGGRERDGLHSPGCDGRPVSLQGESGIATEAYAWGAGWSLAPWWGRAAGRNVSEPQRSSDHILAPDAGRTPLRGFLGPLPGHGGRHACARCRRQCRGRRGDCQRWPWRCCNPMWSRLRAWRLP